MNMRQSCPLLFLQKEKLGSDKPITVYFLNPFFSQSFQFIFFPLLLYIFLLHILFFFTLSLHFYLSLLCFSFFHILFIHSYFLSIFSILQFINLFFSSTLLFFLLSFPFTSFFPSHLLLFVSIIFSSYFHLSSNSSVLSSFTVPFFHILLPIILPLHSYALISNISSSLSPLYSFLLSSLFQSDLLSYCFLLLSFILLFFYPLFHYFVYLPYRHFHNHSFYLILSPSYILF